VSGVYNKVPTLPKVSALGIEMDAAEARRLELWGRRLIDDVVQFQHRQRRRREGRQGVAA
jgi:hypothetical protein